MNAHTTVLLFAFGAAALALWTDSRFPRLVPKGARAALVHVVVALVLSRLMIIGVQGLSDDGSPMSAFAGIFGLALPSLVYLFLVAVWVIKIAQRSLFGGVR